MEHKDDPKIQNIRDEIEHTKLRVLNSIDKAIDRGQNINELSEKSEMLYDTSFIFKRRSTSLKQKLCREKWVKNLILFLFVLLFIYIIIGLTCGFSFQCVQ